MMERDERPVRVPVSLDAWRWPVRIGDLVCGECDVTLRIHQFTAMSELAAAIEKHALVCVMS